jgi:hypothetical protein
VYYKCEWLQVNPPSKSEHENQTRDNSKKSKKKVEIGKPELRSK